MNTIENFHKIKEIIRTNEAVIYEAALNDSDYSMFILKKYVGRFSGSELISEEMKISQEISYYAPDDIVVPILYCIEDTDGNQYAVMEKKRTGDFLQSMVRPEGLPLRRVLRLAEEVLKALCILHSFAGNDPRIGYLHLDLHPGNIFIERDSHDEWEVGRAKFIDFTTSVKTLNGENQERRICSYSAYSAPELYGFPGGACSASTDTYSVGAILYKLLTGGNLPGLAVIPGTTIQFGSFLPGPKPETGERAGKYAGDSCRRNRLPESICRMIDSFFRCSLNYNPRYRYRTAQEMLDSVRRMQNVLLCYDKKDYEGFFNTLYEYGIPPENTQAGETPLNMNNYRKAVTSLERMLLLDHINNRRSKYLLDAYWGIGLSRSGEIPGDIMRSLISSGIAVSNHTGDVKLGDELSVQLDKVSDEIELEKYLVLLNRLAVQKADRFKFAEAVALQTRNIQAQKIIKKGIVEAGNSIGMNSETNTRIVPLARALSSLPGYLLLFDWVEAKGQMSGTDCLKDEAWRLYEEALREFGSDIGNRKITLCHMMHYAITVGDRKKYEQAAGEYFEGEAFEKVIQEAAADGIGNAFGLFALVKGIFVFYADEICSDTYDAICKIGEECLPAAKADDPVMLIYKYIGLLEHHRSGAMTEFARDMFMKSLHCIEAGIIDMNKKLNIYMLISYETKALMNELDGDAELNEQLRNELYAQAERDGWRELVAALDSGMELSRLLCWEYA